MPPELAGRERERDVFRVLMERLASGKAEQSLALWGLRGVGKTVLLNDLGLSAETAGWGSGYVELGGRGPLRPAIATVAAQAAQGLARRPQLADRVKAALRVIKSFGITAMPDGFTFTLNVDAQPGRADTGQLDLDIYEVLFELAQTAREAETGVVLFFDEMQFAERDELAGLLAAIHRIGQRGLPLAVVCAGLPQLSAKLVEASSYAERLFAYIEVDRLTPEAAAAALVRPAEREGVRFDDEALEFILQRTARYPFFLQTYGKFVWLTASASPVTLADAKAADVAAGEQLDMGFHRARFNRATPAERRYLAALAELGDGRQLTNDVASKLGATHKQTAVARQRLIDVKGLIYSPERGYVDFTAPLFGDYVRRHHPLDGLP